MAAALHGVIVVEQAGALCAGLCGGLLAELGARVIRVERAGTPGVHAPGAGEPAALILAGKERVAQPTDRAAARRMWRDLASGADVLILAPTQAADDPAAGLGAAPPEHAVVCTLTALGVDATGGGAGDTDEIVLQAIGGLMAVTGGAGGAPQAVQVPVMAALAALNGAAAILAALAVVRRDGPGQKVDACGFDAAMATLGTFLASIASGRPRGHRTGCRHPLCAPWDVYRCADTWIQVCVAGDAQWRRLATLIGGPALAGDPRYAEAAARVGRAGEIDALVAAWLEKRDPADALATLEAAAIPAGQVRTVEETVNALAAAGRLVEVEEAGRRRPRMESIFALDRTPGRAASFVSPVRSAAPPLASRARAPAAPREPSRPGLGAGPLAGCRVVEIGPYTAGPLAGRYLADLGAEVIKVEPPEGEESRRFRPRFGADSGYFINYNCGKRSVCLDLRTPAGLADLDMLLAGADILLENLKAGALARLGRDPQSLVERFPRLIACSVSGYGAARPGKAALDTVVQAEAGLMACVGHGDRPQKVGLSLADLVAAHVAPVAILAALHERARSGRGQVIDIAMLDCLAWTIQPTWTGWRAPPVRVVTAADGHVAVVSAGAGEGAAGVTRGALVDMLAAQGVTAAPVLELDEVVSHPLAIARGSVRQVEVAQGLHAPVLACPYRLRATPPRIGAPAAAVGADTAAVLADARAANRETKGS